MNPFMQLAVEAAREGMKNGIGGPFGAVIVKNGEVVSVACNEVLATNDPTAHAEITALRKATAYRTIASSTIPPNSAVG